VEYVAAGKQFLGNKPPTGKVLAQGSVPIGEPTKDRLPTEVHSCGLSGEIVLCRGF
jgi:hypothetical protein